MINKLITLTPDTIKRIDRLYELRKWDPHKVDLNEAIARAIAIAWQAEQLRIVNAEKKERGY